MTDPRDILIQKMLALRDNFALLLQQACIASILSGKWSTRFRARMGRLTNNMLHKRSIGYEEEIYYEARCLWRYALLVPVQLFGIEHQERHDLMTGLY